MRLDRSTLLLVLLAGSSGKPFHEAQLQMAVFRAVTTLPDLVDRDAFDFVPSPYGIRDANIVADMGSLELSGDASIIPAGVGRWASYAASPEGQKQGAKIIGDIDVTARRSLLQISNDVRHHARGRAAFRQSCACGEC
jgi:hypothetical protein